jgi:hypothetical protein
VRYADAVERYGRWQERWRDPMLTGLLVLLALEVFVGIPLARTHFSEAPLFVVVVSADHICRSRPGPPLGCNSLHSALVPNRPDCEHRPSRRPIAADDLPGFWVNSDIHGGVDLGGMGGGIRPWAHHTPPYTRCRCGLSLRRVVVRGRV